MLKKEIYYTRNKLRMDSYNIQIEVSGVLGLLGPSKQETARMILGFERCKLCIYLETNANISAILVCHI